MFRSLRSAAGGLVPELTLKDIHGREIIEQFVQKAEGHSPKTARIALATVAALLCALLGLYYDRVLVRARGNSASPASSNVRNDRERGRWNSWAEFLSGPPLGT
jgi:hypothetical protein